MGVAHSFSSGSVCVVTYSLHQYCNVVLGEPEFMMYIMSFGQLSGIIILFFILGSLKNFQNETLCLVVRLF